MSQALITGISGMRTHQLKLDVVANNLANMNTVAFKSSTATFSDLVYNRFKSGSAAGDVSGGTNPQFIGTGVQMGQVAKKFTQGAMESTGELLDFALQGNGFFTLATETGENVFSRAGSFGLDSEGRLVDPSTGYLVQRFGPAGEPTSNGIGFQTPGDSSIYIPLGAAIPGGETQNVELFGNLPADAMPPAAEVLTSFSPYLAGGSPATAATLLSALDNNQTAYTAGDTLTLTGTNPDGSPFSGTMPANGATMGDLVTALNGLMTGATAAIAPNGSLTVTSNTTGDAFISLLIEDTASNVGDTDFANHGLVVTTDGTAGDNYELSMDVFDARGQAHRMVLDFHKLGANSWEVTASVDAGSGTMIDDKVFNLTFNEDGTYAIAGTAGLGDSNVEIQFNSLSLPQTITLDLDELTHLAAGFGLSNQQDGFAPGNLVAVEVSANGMITGLATNGVAFELAQLGIADFSNYKGLNPLGNNLFQQTPSSGLSTIGPGAESGRGSVVGGKLEASNVDVAHEFTQLIVSQRGFSANARTITIASEMLEELTNIVR